MNLLKKLLLLASLFTSTSALANVDLFQVDEKHGPVYGGEVSHLNSVKGVDFYKKDYLVGSGIQIGSLVAAINRDNEVKCVKVLLDEAENVKQVGELGQFELDNYAKQRFGGFQVETLGEAWKVKIKTLVKNGPCN